MTAPALAPSAEANDPFASYRLVGNVMAGLILLVAIEELWRNWLAPKPLDFISFWGAARLAIQGQPALAYDLTAIHQVQSAVADFGASGAQMPFPYMPAFLLLVMPFGFLPFPLAMALWLAVTATAYLMAVRRLFPGSRWLPLAFPPVLVDFAIGQNGFLTAALFAAAMATLPRKPFIAGLIAGCLIFKPQLGLFLPVAFVASREWRAIAGAALSSIAVTLLGALTFGFATMAAWVAQLPLYGRIARDGSVGWIQFTSVYSAARQAGAAANLALALHLIVAAAAAWAVWHAWRSSRDPLAKASVLACATTLASPYLFLYDELILVIPFLWLAQKGCNPALLTALWLLPVVITGQHLLDPSAINLGPILPIGLLILVVQRLDTGSETRLPHVEVARAAVAQHS